jgi:transketolase N-terminal domain/subunit
MLMNMAQSNPNIKQAMDFINQSGGDPQKAFYALAEQKGVNPEDILSQLR